MKQTSTYQAMKVILYISLIIVALKVSYFISKAAILEQEKEITTEREINTTEFIKEETCDTLGSIKTEKEQNELFSTKYSSLLESNLESVFGERAGHFLSLCLNGWIFNIGMFALTMHTIKSQDVLRLGMF